MSKSLVGKRSWLIITATLLLIAGCNTFRWEDQLSRDAAMWYSRHAALMETCAPKFLSDQLDISEASLFLRLPAPQQRQYMEMFWDIRQRWTREAYEERMGHIKHLCRQENRRAGWLTDRGRTLLLCGFPFEVVTYQDGAPAFMDEDMGDIGGQWTQKWIYQWNRKFVFYNFQYVPPHVWRLIPVLSVDSKQNDFENYWREEFAPTREGWEYLFRLLY